MKFVVVLAAIALIASAEIRAVDESKVSGSFVGRDAPTGDFISDYVTGEPASGEFKVLAHKVLKEPLIGQTVTGHALLIQGAGQAYHTYSAHDKCPGVLATSRNSEMHGCKIATNAGFFDMLTGGCIGPIVSDGNIIHMASSLGALFGITNDGKFMAGYANESVIRSGNFKQIVQGRGWLVRNGQSYLDVAADKEGIPKSFIQLLAPRLAIGWTRQGNLILLIVDGIESKKMGLDLKTFTSLLISLGAVEAINLDGGGSVTFVWDGHICESSGVGQEPCKGNPTTFGPIFENKPYERPVTTITCFK